VGRLLQENFREVDLPAHFGEEVFAVVLPYTDGAGASKGAERLKNNIQSRSFLPDSSRPPVRINLRIGIVVYSAPIGGVDEFIQLAEEALYQARKEGKSVFLLPESAAGI